MSTSLVGRVPTRPTVSTTIIIRDAKSTVIMQKICSWQTRANNNIKAAPQRSCLLQPTRNTDHHQPAIHPSMQQEAREGTTVRIITLPSRRHKKTKNAYKLVKNKERQKHRAQPRYTSQISNKINKNEVQINSIVSLGSRQQLRIHFSLSSAFTITVCCKSTAILVWHSK